MKTLGEFQPGDRVIYCSSNPFKDGSRGTVLYHNEAGMAVRLDDGESFISFQRQFYMASEYPDYPQPGPFSIVPPLQNKTVEQYVGFIMQSG